MRIEWIPLVGFVVLGVRLHRLIDRHATSDEMNAVHRRWVLALIVTVGWLGWLWLVIR